MTTSSNTKTYTYTRYPPSISPSIPRLDTEEDVKKAVLANPETTFDDTVDTTGGWYQKDMEGRVVAIVSDQMCEELDARRDHAEAWVKENERREAAGEPPLEPTCWRR
ncbi:hypothetical protein BDV32DRAFT_150300 [Aspergillus pseudonomiae]|uniref:Uncharacterized protein n=1 Tax=Aspergillus pseudonomiae TaxID=1506151 RepID=A0A5N7CZ83_9EURO|nr:uncharacterized protein BDV37DRAFT_287595 [Aspergillus pseudonomiae]KAB8259661.1 hypothetical protein BDV32DRAFT_150300 [Aspergillus pseudonomiae]KAE8399475.1 hypothetical protein BDV37DRAFT_287595 [Aspergillus pseudonomiae]